MTVAALLIADVGVDANDQWLAVDLYLRRLVAVRRR